MGQTVQRIQDTTQADRLPRCAALVLPSDPDVAPMRCSRTQGPQPLASRPAPTNGEEGVAEVTPHGPAEVSL
eukprot:4008230-Alexandrium_andersonii.AAC.1